MERIILSAFVFLCAAMLGIMPFAPTASAAAKAEPHILVISGHPNLENSNANRTILADLAQAFPKAEIRYLDQLYPDWKIDVKAEQKCVLVADVIVFVYPVYWYTAPALLKKWQEDVMTYGFAHAAGPLLVGRDALVSVTSGPPVAAYSLEGKMKHTMSEFQLPFEQMCRLCGIEWHGIVHSGGYILPQKESHRGEQEIAAHEHAKRLISRLNEVIAARSANK